MIPNLTFLYGTDGYRLQKRLKELLIADELNRLVIDAGASWNTAEFASQAQAMPFLGATRQMVIKDALRTFSTDEGLKVIQVAEHLPQTTAVVFVESVSPDKRMKFFKDLTKLAQTEVFEPLKGAVWTQYVHVAAEQSGIRLAVPARDALATNLEGDSGQLHNVIGQLSLWANGREVTAEDVALFTPRRAETDSFKLLGALADQRAEPAARSPLDLWRQDEDPLRAPGAIAYQYRQLLLAKAYLAEDIKQSELSGKLKVPPFVVSRLISLARRASWDWLKSIYQQISRIDEGIKNGKIEAVAGIEVLAYNLLILHSKDTYNATLIVHN